MRIFRYICLLLLSAPVAKAQYNSITTVSLRHQVHTGADTSLPRLYHALFTEFYSHSAFDSAQKVAGEAIIKASKLADKKFESTAMVWMGMVEFEKGNYQDALAIYLNALKIKERVGDQEGQASLLLNIAGIYYEGNNIEKAVEIYLKALQLKIELGDKTGQANIYINLGNVSESLGKLNEAADFYKRGEQLLMEMKDTINAAITDRSLANIYLQQNKVREAEQLAYAAYKYLRLKNDRQYVRALITLGMVNYARGNYIKSTDFLEEAYQKAVNNATPVMVKEASLELAKAYEKLKQYDKSLYFQRLYSRVSDSLQGASLGERIARMQVKYESEKREKAIEHLDMENSKKELELTKRRDQIFIISGIALAFLAWFIAFYFYTNAKKQRELNRVKQERQKEIIETIITTEEKARKKIAADLHDGLGQILTAAKINLANLNEAMPEAKEKLLQVTELVNSAQHESKSMALSLMPLTLKENGLVESIRHICAKYNKPEVQEIAFNAYNVPDKLEPVVEVNTYRICQELLNNAVKYSKAPKIFLQLFCRDKKLIVQIEDNGIGFDKTKTKKDSLGMNTLKERVALLHGEIEIDTAPQKGTNIFIELTL